MTFQHSLVVLAVALSASTLHAQEAKPADNTPKLASGLLMKQGDKLIFAPCRDRSYSTVDDISPERSVTKALDSVGLAAGKKLYVELMAVLEGGMVRASGLNLARTEGRCQQQGGNEESLARQRQRTGLVAGRRAGSGGFEAPGPTRCQCARHADRS